MTNPASLAVWFPTIRANSGADVFTERLCAGLNARGIRAEITWLPLRAEYAPWSVPVPTPPKWATVVHVNTWLHPRLIPEHLPIVATMHHCVHDPALDIFKKPLQRLYHALWIKHVEASVLQRTQLVTAVSHYTAAQTKHSFGARTIEVIHNCIDLNGPFQPGPPRTPHKRFRLLYAGNWIARKGTDLLGPIMEALGPEFELRYTADRHGNHTQSKLPGNCYCLGRLPGTVQVALAYQEADALLLPSRLEGFGLTALEAMACGLPVIAARTSALPEVVEDGVSGLLCPADDIESFATAARRLRADLPLWQRMRRAARQRAEELFATDKQLHAYIRAYQRAMDMFRL